MFCRNGLDHPNSFLGFDVLFQDMRDGKFGDVFSSALRNSGLRYVLDHFTAWEWHVKFSFLCALLHACFGGDIRDFDVLLQLLRHGQVDDMLSNAIRSTALRNELDDFSD